MNRMKLSLSVGLPLLLVVGATVIHRTRRASELTKQANLKKEGAVTVTLCKVEERPFRGSVPFTGTLLAVNRAELKAEVAGRVTRITVFEGDRVSRGTVLSAQDEEDLLLSVQAAEAQLAQAQAQADQAKRDWDRAQMLLEKRSITKQSAQQAETLFNATQAGARAAESNLGLAKSRLHKSQIKAPFEGQVAQRLIQVGEMLNPGQPAFTVVDNRKLEILADLPTQALAHVQPGLKVRFRIPGFDQPIEGRVAQVAPAVLQDGRTLRVRMEVPNVEGHLKSGLFAEGEILADGTTTRPALPASLLTAMGQEADVYVALNGTAQRKRINLGKEQDGWRAVDGLPTGTFVVAQGRDQVTDGTRLRVVETPSAGKVN